MPPRDRSRLIYSLAGALLARDWNAQTLADSLRHAVPDHPLHAPRLIARLRATFSQQPTFRALITFLRHDRGLPRLLASTAPPPVTAPAMEAPPHRLRDITLPDLPTEGRLAAWLGLAPPRLQWLADIAGRNRHQPPGPLRAYRYRWIPRRHGLPRLLEIPKRSLKRIQRIILTELLNIVPAHPAAHGFVRHRSTLTNALPHCAKPAVLRFDLVDFFPSISSARVFHIFRTLGYPATVARLLTGLCTTRLAAAVWEAHPGPHDPRDFAARQRLITPHLPQGAPTSPALANLAALRLDRRLAGLAAAGHAAYTRYADDLTFSGDLARAAGRFAPLVALIAHEEGFAINHRKTRFMRAGVRQHVTGLVVNIRPNIRRADYDRLKAILTNCLRHGPASQNRAGHPDFAAHLAGKLAHLASIHPARAAKLQSLFNQITWPAPGS